MLTMRRRLDTFTRAALQALHGPRPRPTLRDAIAATAGAAGAAIAIALMETGG
jgi:hypothetical protein